MNFCNHWVFHIDWRDQENFWRFPVSMVELLRLLLIWALHPWKSYFLLTENRHSLFCTINVDADNSLQSLPMFWPAEQEQTMYGGIVVATEQEEVKADSIERNFIVWHKEACFFYKSIHHIALYEIFGSNPSPYCIQNACFWLDFS